MFSDRNYRLCHISQVYNKFQMKVKVTEKCHRYNTAKFFLNMTKERFLPNLQVLQSRFLMTERFLQLYKQVSDKNSDMIHEYKCFTNWHVKKPLNVSPVYCTTSLTYAQTKNSDMVELEMVQKDRPVTHYAVSLALSFATLVEEAGFAVFCGT